jgi:catechol 2,3-dioxygenase-like lactoylglutathione lyase family enzyme
MNDDRAVDVRLEGLTLSVRDVGRSMEFYTKLGFSVAIDSRPDFGMVRIGGPYGGTIGLLLADHAEPATERMTSKQRAAIHVELSTDNLDALYEQLKARGVNFHEPPHDEPWERSMAGYDPDGYTVEFAQGRRGYNAPQ